MVRHSGLKVRQQICGRLCNRCHGKIGKIPSCRLLQDTALPSAETGAGSGHAAACVLSADTPTLPAAILVTAATLLLTGSESRPVIALSPRHAGTPLGSVRRHRLEHRHCRGADAGARGRAGSRPGRIASLVRHRRRRVARPAGAGNLRSNTAPWTRRHAIEALGLPVPMRLSRVA